MEKASRAPDKFCLSLNAEEALSTLSADSVHLTYELNSIAVQIIKKLKMV